jgi:hypothetical protein
MAAHAEGTGAEGVGLKGGGGAGQDRRRLKQRSVPSAGCDVAALERLDEFLEHRLKVLGSLCLVRGSSGEEAVCQGLADSDETSLGIEGGGCGGWGGY